jgi:oligopeptide transport system ATP-binding protein
VPIPDPVLERARPRPVLEGDLPSPLRPPSGCVFRTRCPKAKANCATEPPPPYDIGQGQYATCHYWDEPTPMFGKAAEATVLHA